MTRTQQVVYEHITNGGAVWTASDLAEATGLSESECAGAMLNLLAQGRITTLGTRGNAVGGPLRIVKHRCRSESSNSSAHRLTTPARDR